MQTPNYSTAAQQIGDVAKLVAISVDAIRFYERTALLPSAPRTVGRFRLYAKADVARLSFIKQMQGLGFSLQEVRQLLDLRERPQESCPEVRDLLRTKLEKVRTKIWELEQLEQHLVLDMRKCKSALKRRRTRATSRPCLILGDSEANKPGNKC